MAEAKSKIEIDTSDLDALTEKIDVLVEKINTLNQALNGQKKPLSPWHVMPRHNAYHLSVPLWFGAFRIMCLMRIN